MDFRFGVRFSDIPKGERPKTIIVITASETSLLSFRLPTGEALYTELKGPPKQLASVRETLPLGVRSLPSCPNGQLRMMLATAFCAFNSFEPDEMLLQRVGHVADYLKLLASEVNKVKGRVMNVEVHYHYCLRRVKIVAVDQDDPAARSDTAAPVIHQPGTKFVLFERPKTLMRLCSLCLLDFHDVCFALQLPCYHRFHATCVENWLRRNPLCPLCGDPPPPSGDPPQPSAAA